MRSGGGDFVRHRHKEMARPAGLGTIRGELREPRCFPKTALRSDPRSGSRARQDSNLRPPA